MSDPGQWRSNASEGNFASDPSSRVIAEAGTQIALAALPSLMVPPTATPIVTPSPCDPSGWSDQPASAWGIYFRRISARSEEHTSELQSLMRISYAAFCLQKKKTKQR